MSVDVVVPSAAATTATAVIHGTFQAGTDHLDMGGLSFPSEPTGYMREKWAFEAQRDELSQRYGGGFVAIHDGQVVDHDESQRELSKRFFTRHPNAHVYIGFVGPRRVVRIPTPIVHRRTAD